MKKRKNIDPRSLAVPPREDVLHRQVVDFLTVALPERVLWFHTPNGGLRDPIVAAQLKALGVLPGVLDLAFFWSEPLFYGTGERFIPRVAWLELKSGTGTLSEDQARFITRALFMGHETGTARTLEEAVNELKRMGVPLRGRVSA